MVVVFFICVAMASFAVEFNSLLIRNTSLNQLKTWVKEDPILMQVKDDLGRTPLHLAVEEGRLSLVNLFIKSGAVVNATDSLKAFSPLHYACLHSYTKIARFLLARGAWVNLVDREGNTPLYYASGNGNSELVDILLLHGANRNVLNSLGQSPLHACLLLGKNKNIFPYSRKSAKSYLKTLKVLDPPVWLVNYADCNGISPILSLQTSNLPNRVIKDFYSVIFYKGKR